MKYSDILKTIKLIESPIDIAHVIDECKKKFGENELYGGNCGTFAIALGTFLEDNGINSHYVLFTDYDDEDGGNISVSDLINYECSVYHVALHANGKLYDGDGETTDNVILDWIESEYNDDGVSVTNFPFSDQKVKTLIRNDTDWNIPSETFYTFLKEIV